jgi:hypothetical protein
MYIGGAMRLSVLFCVAACLGVSSPASITSERPASPPSAPTALELPFRWTPGQIEIPVSIDGRAPIWCILDSGAEFSMLDDEVARQLRLGPRIRQGGRERIENLTWKMGPVTMTGQAMTLWALDNFRRQKRDIRGVIGYEVFEHYVVTIDFQRRVILLTEPSSFRPDPAATPLPLSFAGRLPVIRASLRFGKEPLPAKLMIDTGAATTVILRHPFATRHRLIGSDSSERMSETVALGRRPFITLSARELKIHRWTFPNPAVEAYGSTAGAGGYTETDGLLGNHVLQNFRVTFDYARKRLFLEETRDLR